MEVLVIEAGQKAPSAFASALAATADVPEDHAKPENLGNRRLGGASWTWGGRCVAYDHVDFEPRPGAEAPGWPILYEDMMAPAARAAAFLGIGSPDFRPPQTAEPGLASLPAVLERWCATPQLVKRHRQALRDSRSIRVQMGLVCTGLQIGGQGRVEQISCKTWDGTSVIIRADIVVLAAGGIENARLLLWAFDPLPAHAKPRWLGRGYMGHLHGSLADVVLSPIVAMALDYFLTKEGCFARRRLTIDPEIARTERLLNIGFHIDNPPMRNPIHRSAGLSATALALSSPGLGRALLSATMREVLLGPPLTGKETLGHMANICRAPLTAITFSAKAFLGRFGIPVRPGVIVHNGSWRYTLKYYSEQSARCASHVALSEVADALGVPRVRIAPYVAAQDVESVLKAHDVLDRSLRHLGLGRLVYHVAPDVRAQYVMAQSGDGYHQIGLARMGMAAETSVTDSNGCVHGTNNLFVAGSALFPTSSQANPTFFIVCQALRLSAHLIARSSQSLT